MTGINHDEPYSDDYLQDILASVKTIAMVGASPDKTKFSYGVLRVLHETGYDMIPVNPRPGLAEIRGLKVFPTLAAIDRPVDMVEVFVVLKIYMKSPRRPLRLVRKCYGAKLVLLINRQRGLQNAPGCV